jgi:serine protease AprX
LEKVMNIKQYFLLILTCATSVVAAMGQEYNWIYFSDKPLCENIDILDCPVNSDYLEELKKMGVEVVGTSNWLNAACVKGTLNSDSFEFISRVNPLGRYTCKSNGVPFDTTTYGNSRHQLRMLGLDYLHDKGFTGNGVKIALFDAGFFNVDSMTSAKSMRDEGRIVETYDFVLDDTLSYRNSAHGRYVLSIAGGNLKDSLVGAAPGGSFYLARTENEHVETHLEEYYWVYALEWASNHDVDIIHSSLGYSRFDTLQGDYSYSDMDGETTIITQATDIAVSKGIFVTNSAGNEGNSEWRYITAPCDGKGVLCVGAVDSFKRRARFSSVGPSYDQRVKPDVMAMGRKTSFQSKEGEIQQGNGTSFSGPLIAGMVACLMEAHPNSTNQEIFNAIIQSADRYNNPDTLYGYGIPNAIIADSILSKLALSLNSVIENIEISPNPFQYSLRISGVERAEFVTLYDVEGRVVLRKKTDSISDELEIDASSLESGIYTLIIGFDNGEEVRQKVLKVSGM